MASILSGMKVENNFAVMLYNPVGTVNLALGALTSLQSAASMVQNTYQDMSQTISNAGQNISESAGKQESLNEKIDEGTKKSGKFASAIKSMADKYLTLANAAKVMDLSDSITQTSSRLNFMNDGLQSTQELMNAIYTSAQNTHTPFLETANAIADMGNIAGAAFGSNMELVAFMEQVNKQLALGGASAQDQTTAMTQLSQAMASGTLKSDQLNSVLKAAPGIAQTIEQSMGWAEGSFRSYAEQGAVTAEVIKNSLLGMADDTNEKFESMPVTFGQAMTDFKSSAVMAFQPVLQRLNELVNSSQFAVFAQNATDAMVVLAGILLDVWELVGEVGSWIGENWSVIGPIVAGVAVVMGLYTAALIANSIAQGIKTIAEKMHKIATDQSAKSTIFAATSQQALNTALLSCPLTWIILLIIALIAVIFAVSAAIAKATGVAGSGFGIILGCANVTTQALKNFALFVANVFLGICFAVQALKQNLITAFHNAISNVQSMWYTLLGTALTVISTICEKLNSLPFIEIDYSGISDTASDYFDKALELQANKEEYINISDAFDKGFSTFDAFEDGWAADAFSQGAEWGDGIAGKISGFSLTDLFGMEGLPGTDDSQYLFEKKDLSGNAGLSNGTDVLENEGVFDNMDGIASDTSDILDSLAVSAEDLKYLRDLAEQEAVNRFTTAEIRVEMNNSNHISKDADLDGIVDGLTAKVLAAMELVQEGV